MGSALIAWEVVCKPKNHGGLWVLDILKQNKALLIKNLHKFFNKASLPWVKLIWKTYYDDGPPQGKLEGSFWWKSHLKLIPLYKEVATCQVDSGQTVLFWKDNWNGQAMIVKYPELHSFAIKNNITLAEMSNPQDLSEQFHIPLSSQAFTQYNLLMDTMNQTNLSTTLDSWTYIWKFKDYTPKKMYLHLMGVPDSHCFFKQLWKCAGRIRKKNLLPVVFIWQS